MTTASARAAGILLHPTSLPGPFGIGDLGHAAYDWIETLLHAKQKCWQILPLGPTGFGDSPYQCFSAFAGNPFLISPEFLVRDGLLDQGDLAGVSFPAERVDFGPVIIWKNNLLARAWENFRSGRGQGLRDPFNDFTARHMSWLDDYGLFMALKDTQGGRSWLEWPTDLRLRAREALVKARRDLADSIGLHQFRQFLFFRQWQDLKDHVRRSGLKIIGDIPIFVSSDSADVWANPQFFQLDKDRRPTVVAGVPPDYFSPTGQLWGNPLYHWEALSADGYHWWLERLKACLQVVDLIRLDHFRGFEAYWEIPAGAPNAITGRWVKAPGRDLLRTIENALGEVPILAEDLGVITPEVEALRDEFHLPGMRILQFAFDSGPTNRFLPHNYASPRTVVYTGTHDNDTTRGWFQTAPEHERDYARRYLARDGNDITWDLIRLGWSSSADCAIVPLQDVLDLGPSARMNFPGRPAGNWGWRFTQLSQGFLDRLRDLTELYGR
ncbi:MAG: 4-alpha-glucanotransferase [Planctomycetes bacterium]|nr:4-alpha-glucanotransferase [Planctomycetota bacterium]